MNRVSMMGELAASLSHEITQPIASARNNARAAQNFLDMQPPDLGEVREALSCVVADADRAGDIIDRIRDHIKKTHPRKEHFDLNEAINEVISLARSAITKNGVSVQTRLMEGALPAQGDRVQLQQVVLNLILNAVEAMGSVDEGARELLLSTAQSGTCVLVAVRDSGPGIDPERRERVFDAFYTTKSSGVGMGLSICRSIINAHGGRLWAEVNTPRGAVFRFILPGADNELEVRSSWAYGQSAFQDFRSIAAGLLTVANVGRLGPARTSLGRLRPVGAEFAREASNGGRRRLSTHFTTTSRFSDRLCLPGQPPNQPPPLSIAFHNDLRVNDLRVFAARSRRKNSVGLNAGGAEGSASAYGFFSRD